MDALSSAALWRLRRLLGSAVTANAATGATSRVSAARPQRTQLQNQPDRAAGGGRVSWALASGIKVTLSVTASERLGRESFESTFLPPDKAQRGPSRPLPMSRASRSPPQGARQALLGRARLPSRGPNTLECVRRSLHTNTCPSPNALGHREKSHRGNGCVETGWGDGRKQGVRGDTRPTEPLTSPKQQKPRVARQCLPGQASGGNAPTADLSPLESPVAAWPRVTRESPSPQGTRPLQRQVPPPAALCPVLPLHLLS